MKCGYVAVLGRPNAGKSSLVNCIVGEEVAIVSHRQQTTRNNILGIYTDENAQIIFVDTPGIHHSKNKLDKFMMKNVRSAIATADVVLYLFDGSKILDEEELSYIEMLKNKVEKLIIVQTKSDKKSALCDVASIAISVKSMQNILELKKRIVELLPEQEKLYEDDMFTDKSIKFLISEKVRGLLLENIDKEIPHGVAVVVENFCDTGKNIDIEITIICERETHKGIIIGKAGANIKKIGQLTREYAENLTGEKVNLQLFVKVDEDWRDKNTSKYGY